MTSASPVGGVKVLVPVGEDVGGCCRRRGTEKEGGLMLMSAEGVVGEYWRSFLGGKGGD